MPINNSGRSGISLRELLARARARVAVERALPEAVWVRAEVSKADFKGSYVFLDLVERSTKGQVAKVRAVMWNARPLLVRFRCWCASANKAVRI